MSDTLAPPLFDVWVRDTLGSPGTISFEAMIGATSSSVYAVAVGGERRFVLRLFADRNWLEREPDLADHEAAALKHAQRAGLPAPTLIAQASAAECGVPAVLMTYLPGRVELRPPRRKAWLSGLANTLAIIHRADADNFGWRYSSWNLGTDRTMPPWLDDRLLWSAVLALADERPVTDRRTFLHRDFHPVNVLWQGETVAGVVDWVNACSGPAGVDVAHCRLNLALMYGNRAANDFLNTYAAAVGGYDHDPHWDVDDALGWNGHDPVYYSPWRDFGLRPISRALLRDRMREFLQQAVAQRFRDGPKQRG